MRRSAFVSFSKSFAASRRASSDEPRDARFLCIAGYASPNQPVSRSGSLLVADVDDLVKSGRTLGDAVLRLASELLAAGVAPSRVHARYVAAAFELLEELETRALLASASDPEAAGRLGLLVGELRQLGEEARAELRRQTDDDRGT
jgi:hypothetical protein